MNVDKTTDLRPVGKERRRYLFVSGCPRSGTSVLTTLLNWSDEAFVCQERFAPLIARKPHLFVPEMYHAPRILRFEKADCGYASFAEAKGYSSWYANPKRFDDPDSYSVIGDKITHLFRRFDLLERDAWAYEHVTLIHILRNPIDVANSYAVRHADPVDAWEWDCERAIADWIESVEKAHAFHASASLAGGFALLDYDTMFDSGLYVLEDHARALYGHCGLEFGARQQVGVGLIHEAASVFKGKREVSAKVVAAVRAGIPNETMRKYIELRQKCLAKSAPSINPSIRQEANS